MTVRQCEICRSYRHDGDEHRCPGLRTVDWLRFVHALREWMATDNTARFVAYYAHRQGADRAR